MYLLSNETRKLLMRNYSQTVDITLQTADGTISLNESNITNGGLTIDRYSVSGSKIELGSVCAAELSLIIDNTDGKFNNVRFEGAELYVILGVLKTDALRWENATKQYIPCGYFTVDAPPRALSQIKISALDRMASFDKKVVWSNITFPITVKDLLSYACLMCNVPLGVDITGLPNWDYVINSPPEEDSTFRQVIQWIAELTATCGFINWDGELDLSWYKPTDQKITPSERYESDMFENDITITGVSVVDEDETSYLVGNESYAFEIKGNPLIQHDYASVARAIYSVVGGFTYRPYECTTKPMPYLYPMDMVEFVDKDGISHNTIVTNIAYTINGGTSISGKGETETANGYAASNPLTKQESIVIKRLKKAAEKDINSNLQSALHFNELITNSLGMYFTTEELEDGSRKYYMHDSPTLEASNTIYTLNSGGYAYTNSGWNNGNPIWQYGETKDGNAIFNKVCAYGLEVSNPNGSYSSTISPYAFKIWQNSTLIFDASKEGLKIFNGGITIFKGVGSYAQKAMYFDTDGNIALDGYLTQIGSSHRALIGTNEQGYGGFYLYNRNSSYKRTDGTYKPYFEVWTSTNNHTVIEGTNELRFIVSTVANENEGNFSKLNLNSSGAETYGTWNINGALNIYNAVKVHNNVLQFWYNDGAAESGFVGTGTWGDRNILLLKSDGVPLYMTYADDSGNDGARIVLDGDNGTLYGKFDFNQEQKFSHTINAPAFICRSGSTKIMSLYISTGNNPCFNSDNGKDYYFSVSGNTKFSVSSSGAAVYGEFKAVTTNNYTSIITDKTGNGGGHLWGTWYLYADTPISSDSNKKNSIEDLSAKYTVFFDKLRPVRYKYNDGTSDRYHTGFIAQDIETALMESEIDSTEFAGFVRTKDDECFLRYTEFIALAVNEIQLLKKQNLELMERMNSILTKLEV